MLPYFLLIPTISALICLFVGIVCWRYLLTSFRLIILAVFVSCLVDGICLSHFQEYNGIIHNIYCFVDFFLLLFASYSLVPALVRSSIYGGGSLLFTSLWVYFVFVYENSPNTLASYAIASSSLLLTINYLVVLYYSELLQSGKLRIAIRIVCFSLTIYFCGTFTLFLEIKPYLENQNIPDWFVDINTLLYSIKNLVLCFSFYKFKQYRLTQLSME